MFGLFKSQPKPYIEKRGFLSHRKTETLDEAIIRIYPNGNIIVRKGEYTHYEAAPVAGNPNRFTILGPEPYYKEFIVAE